MKKWSSRWESGQQASSGRDTQTALRFEVGVCHLYPGEKLPPGDTRWGQHTHSFVREVHSIESLARVVAVDGHAVSAVMRDDHRTGANFVSAQHLALDYDQGAPDCSVDALADADFLRDHAAIIHETISSTPEEPRSRVIFILDSPITDPLEYRLAAEALLCKFGTADERCKDEARFFYGRKNARHVVLGNVLYKDVLYEQVIEPFQRTKVSTNGHRRSGPIPDAITHHRNNTLTSLGGTMRHRGMSEEAIYAALAVVNAERCVPPLDDDEVGRIARSAARYEPAPDGHKPLPSKADKEEEEPPVLSLFTARDIARRQVTWVWPQRIPQGKQTIIGGDPGLGKSYLTLDIAARVSLGGPWPDGGLAPQGKVMIISAEDDWEDTIRPRLELLEADLSRIIGVSTTLRKGGKEVYFSLAEHLHQLENAIVNNNVTLVILDPILAFTGRRTDTYKSSEVRAVLAPLASMAARTGCAIVSILHLNKRSGEATSIYRLTASLDFTAAARSVLVVGRHPDDADKRVLAPVKCNLSAPPKSMGFHFTQDGVLVWDGEVDLGAEDVLAPPVREETGARDDAKQFLKDALEDGAVPAKQILAEARECGIAEKTLRRAAKDLGVDIAHLGKPGEKGGGKWVWRMPQQDGQQDGQDVLCEKGGHLDSPSNTKRGPGPSDSGHLANPQNLARWQDGHLPTHRDSDHLDEKDGDAEVEI